MRQLLLTLAFATGLLIPLHAAEEIPVGSALRKELFDSIRPQAEKLADKPIKFLGSMKQESGWVVFLGQIVDKSGQPINIGDAESSEAFGLWQRKSGAWKLVEFNAGFTDAFYVDYPKTLGVPKALLIP